MSLKNLQINPFNISVLYANSLVAQQNILVKSEIKKVSTLQYLGKNKKFVSIIVHDVENLHISDSILPFLTTLLGACKLNLDDVSIINTAKQSISIQQLQTTLQCKHLILFGVATTDIDLPMVFPEYHIHQFNGTNCLSSHSLQKIQPDSSLKSQLWLCLKQMFSI
jgi:hypothetical protein